MTTVASSPRSVAIIVVTWNGLSYTRRCLESLRRETSFADYSVIVVDNASSDGTVEYLAKTPWVRMIRNRENLGFGRACNLGIAAADRRSDLVLLNNDTVLLQGDWLERLQRAALSAAEIGIVGCRLVYPSGRLQHAGTEMLTTYHGTQLGALERNIRQYPGDRYVEGVTFACAYIRREVPDAIGGLDEDYFAYFEDTDYCLRAREAGFRTLYCGEVTVEHREHGSSEANGARVSQRFLLSRETFRRKWATKMEARRCRSLGWHSVVSLEGGYEQASRNLILALERQDVSIAYRYAYELSAARSGPEPPEVESDRIHVIRERVVDPPDVQVTFAQADHFRDSGARRHVGYSMLEVDGLPMEWVSRANRMDEVWVPSRFNLESFRASGVTRPIHVMPLGIDPDYFHPEIESFHPGNAFLFLSIFEWGERKAPEILLRAFNEEFRRREDAVLLCHVLNRDPSVDVAGEVRRLGLGSTGGRILFSLNALLPFHQMPALYRSADCFVLPTRGEGWGLPTLEAMACGLPVISTDWGGSRDFLDESNGYPLKIDGLVPAIARCPHYEGFRWAEPSVEHLRVLLRQVFERRDEARQKGLEAARQVRERWTWESSARRIIARLDALGASL